MNLTHAYREGFAGRAKQYARWSPEWIAAQLGAMERTERRSGKATVTLSSAGIIHVRETERDERMQATEFQHALIFTRPLRSAR